MTTLSGPDIAAYLITAFLLLGSVVFSVLAWHVWTLWRKWQPAVVLVLVAITSPLAGYQFGRIILGFPPLAQNTAVWRPYMLVYIFSVIVLAVVLDFTIVQVARAEDRALQKARELDSVREDYISVTSHELRTPLAAIVGYVGMLKDMEVPEPIREVVNGIYRGTARLRLVVQYTTAMSPKLDIQPFAVSEMIEEILGRQQDDLHTSTRHKPGDFEFATDIQPCTVEADYGKLQTAVFELVRNAIKNSGEGNGIVVKSACRDGFLVISVRDEGRGIPYEHQDKVWGSSYQIYDNVMSRPHEGSGLGLAMVKRVAELHQGYVSLTSAPNLGSVFFMHIPMRRV